MFDAVEKTSIITYEQINEILEQIKIFTYQPTPITMLIGKEQYTDYIRVSIEMFLDSIEILIYLIFTLFFTLKIIDSKSIDLHKIYVIII